MPFDPVSRSKGGQTTAEKRRRKALSDYYSDPVICKYCGKVIEVRDGEKPSQVRRKMFCDRSCRASHVNINRARTSDEQEKEEVGKKTAGPTIGTGRTSDSTRASRTKSRGNNK